jgi:hypothetical protein
MRPVNGLVAAGCPAGAARQEKGVVEPSDQDLTIRRLFLEVALKAQGGVACPKHLGIDRSVGQVAGGATFTEGFMLEHEGPPLHLVALEAVVVYPIQVHTAEGHGGSLMWVMAIDARDFPIQNRMRMLESEFTLLVEVTLETDGS